MAESRPYLEKTFASLPRTTRGMPIVLGGDPKGKHFLYTNNHSVFIRDLANPSVCDIYTQHATHVNVAKYSPSGFYIASGDKAGKVRIWDTINKEHILKNEFQPFAGPIKDLDWSGDNQRICVVGEGREKFGAVFNAETGTSTGEIMGQSKSLNSVAFRPDRPFKIATASEDNSIAFFEGPPFKYKGNKNDHTRFANCVRYAPNGAVFISGGADGNAFIYDGKTAEKKGQLGNPAHKGGIYALAFSPDSKKVLTVSGDKTCKMWNIEGYENGELITEFAMGTKIEDMQVGCLWQGDHMIAVSLSGHINYLDKNNPDKPHRIIKGHNKPITSMVLSPDKSTIFTSDSQGIVCHWDVQTGHNDIIQGKGHNAIQIQDMAVIDDELITVGIDDQMIVSSIATSQYGAQMNLPSQPKAVAAVSSGLYVVACINNIVLIRDGRIVYNDTVSYEPSCVGVHPDRGTVAIGGAADNKVYVYDLNGNTLQEIKVLEQTGSITSIEYSPDGTYMAAADGNRKIHLYNLPDYSAKITSQWCAHTSKVRSIAWSPDSLHLASGGIDTNIIIFDPTKPMNYKTIKNAHPQNPVNKVQWLDNETVVSAGQDSCVKVWKI